MSICRIQCIQEGRPNPRTCPTCGVSGRCAFGLTLDDEQETRAVDATRPLEVASLGFAVDTAGITAATAALEELAAKLEAVKVLAAQIGLEFVVSESGAE